LASNFKIIETGVKTPHEEMKRYIQRSAVYLALAKETWGIGIAEACASGIPVLGWSWGNVVNLVQHGVNGYLAKPNDVDDLCEG
jgi:glycosyltransferase involved in cell wall biosynthesis